MLRKVIFVIGVNASGKTYYINRTYGKEDVDLLNIYDFQQRAYDEAGFGEMIPFGAEFGCLMNANNALLDDIIRRLSSGGDVVVEHTLYKAKRRIAYIEKIRDSVKDVCVEVYVMCPASGQLKENLKARGHGKQF